jgi:catechol 2,3-dioxygenase-like lactoylglutathione lyase family enzyme
MVKTYGLTHVALAVRDVERSLTFYQQVFGVEAYFREEGRIHVRTPGCHDVITFDQTAAARGPGGGVIHFGFRLRSPSDIDEAVREGERAGGTVLRRGEFSPGFPYAYVADPDGYEVEIWYE